MKRRLFLITDKADFPRAVRPEGEIYWLFLGRNYERLTYLRQAAPPSYKYVDLGDRLDRSANENRRAYIDYIASLSAGNNDLAWWISPVAEKNTMANPGYLYVCLLLIVEKLLNGELRDKNVCIFSESVALLETIRRSGFASGYQAAKNYNYPYHTAFELLKAIYRTGQFAVKSCQRKIAAVATRSADRHPVRETTSELTVIRTWVGANNLDVDGSFKELYMPGLHEYLNDKNIKAVILPIVNVSDNFPYTEALRRFRRSQLSFIIPEDYYSFSDYVRSAIISIRSYIMTLKKHVFKGLDISLIMQAENLGCVMLWETDQVLMHYFLMKRLKQSGFKINRVIITFENMFPEKTIIVGAAEFLPGAKMVAFQHVCLYPLMLSSYTSTLEDGILPLPDKIICSGPFSRDILSREGFPADRLTLGPALRFQYLLSPEHHPARAGEKVILVPLTLAKPMAMEVLIKVAGAIMEGGAPAEVWIKPHPMMGQTDINGILELANLPAGSYSIVKAPMAELLPQATVMITTATATIFDAIAYGTPVIRVKSDLGINLDPMDWFPKDELHYVARTPVEIARELQRIFSLNASQLEQIQLNGKKMIELCFYPANEETLSEFIR